MLKGAHNLTDDGIYQVEYEYAEEKYQIGEQTSELSVCIFTEGSTVSDEEMQRYFKSIENLNYTNFHVVYVNENSTDFRVHDVLAYLKSSPTRINNRIKVVNNLQHLGTLANTYFWVRKFCQDEDIVLVLGKDEEIIGRQTLKILNSIYQSPRVWYSSFKFVEQHKNNSEIFFYSATNFHKRSFRKKLLNVIPIQSLMDYKFDETTNTAWPKFYKSSINEISDFFQF